LQSDRVKFTNLRPFDENFNNTNRVSLFQFIIPRRNSAPLGQGVLIIKASRSHSDRLHSVGFPWTSDGPSQRPLSTKIQRSHETDFHAQGGIRTHVPASKRPQIRALGRTDTGTGIPVFNYA